MNRLYEDLTGGYPVRQSRWVWARDVALVLLVIVCLAVAAGAGGPA